MDLKHTYSHNITHKKIIIFGFIPPPLGGVSVHIERVIAYFKKSSNDVTLITCEFRFRRLLLPFYLLYVTIALLVKQPNIIYYHAIALPTAQYELWMLAMIKKVLKAQLILVEHDPRHIYHKNQRALRNYRQLLHHVDHLVFIGTSAYKSYRDCYVMPASYSIESAFLSPELDNYEGVHYPHELMNFVKQHGPLIAMNAFGCILVDNHDLYGIDVALESLAILKQEYSAIGIVLVIAQKGNIDHWNKLQQLIVARNLTEHVSILLGQYRLWPLFKYTDIFLRPTLSDGYSVSIEEALYCGVPVVASDAVARPSSVCLFKTGDYISCAQTTKSELEKRKLICQQLHEVHSSTLPPA